MSLKVPRGFQTYSEDAIAEQYAKQRQLDVLRRHQEQVRQENHSVIRTLVIGIILVAAAVLAKTLLS